MKQAIAGVAPPELGEVTSMIVWPTIGSTAAGRLVGRLSGVRLGFGIFTVGNLLALATIPLSLAAYAWLFMPYVCRRYRLTNRRVIVERGLQPAAEQAADFDEFDAVTVEVLPGQAWLRAGDVILVRDGREVLRLAGVSRPEIFRETCLKARAAALAVRRVCQSQATGLGAEALASDAPAG